MAERNYTVPENPVYDPNIRALLDSDPASASGVFNPLFEQLIANIHAVKLLVDGKADAGADGKVPLSQLPIDSKLAAGSNNLVSNALVYAALDNINQTIAAINAALGGKAASTHSHGVATTAAAGFMSAADKAKLDGVAAKATANAASTTAPKALGTAAAGKEAGFARGDHVHPKPSAADIGAAAASHKHTKSQITDFPSTMAPTAHKHAVSDLTGILPVANGGTGNNSGYVRVGQKAGTTIGQNATAEGLNTTASGWEAHAEGRYTEATESRAHAEGENAIASGMCSHAEGNRSIASGSAAHAEGYWIPNNGVIIGSQASGEGAHAEGKSTVASGEAAHSEGIISKATADCSHAGGYNTVANNVAGHSIGKFNKAMTAGGSLGDKTGDAFVIGNGTGDSARANAFRVTFAGQVYGLSAFNTSGADYAEYFEWLDANPEAEDRVGFFVTTDGDKIRKANAADYVLGIVSANPCIIGNADEDWLGRWEHDEFGRFKIIEVETPVTALRTKEIPVLDENGEPTGEVRIETEEVATGEVIHGWDYKQNPEYDNTQQYVERKDRPEWSAVGMLGVLAVRDDGSCQVNGYCRCTDGGTATAADKYIPGQTWRVIARVTENIVKVVFR